MAKGQFAGRVGGIGISPRAAGLALDLVPGKPGAYRAVAFMRPHYQLDEIGIAMRLVADLPAAAS